MSEPIRLYRDDEQVVVFAPSEAARLRGEGWQDTQPVAVEPVVDEKQDAPEPDDVPLSKRTTPRKRKA